MKKGEKSLLLVILILSIELLILFTQYAGFLNSISLRTTDTAVLSIFIEGEVNPPAIALISPADGYSTTDNKINFEINATDPSYNIINCSLIIEGVVVQTLSSITNGGITAFAGSFSDGTFSWSANCTNSMNQQGNSSTRTLTVTKPGEVEAGGSIGGGAPGEGEAGEADYYIKMFNYGDGREIGIKPNRKIFFQVKAIQHKLTLIKIGQGYAIIDINSTPIRATLAINETKMFDVDGDGTFDISVRLNSIDYAKWIAYFDVQKILPAEEKPEVYPVEKKPIMAAWLLGIVSALIAAAFAIWALWEEIIKKIRERKLKRKIEKNGFALRRLLAKIAI